jgi:prolyl-tRNA editing enzyme YbaK/EbsC (Cys-tRNA(Pro) deacylase)
MSATILPASAARVAAAAEALGLAITVRVMEAATRTAEEAAAACGCEVGQIVKSLVFEGAETGRPVLLLVSGANRVDEAGIADQLGEPLRRPNGARVREVTGFAIGGIPPFGHAVPLATSIDADLLAHPVVWAAAGTPNAVFPVNPRALAVALAAPIIKVA